MADVKPVDVTPAAEPVAETKPVEETVAAPAVETTAPAAETEAAPAATEATETPAAAVEEAKEEEKKPVEEGHLSHKGEGANFPKNLIYSKKLFWFGTEPVDLKAVGSFKADKVAEVAHHVQAWASETGKGLLFFGEKDKSAPQGAVQLAEASEPSTDGANKFFFTSKGHKHSFKAATTAERDAWVAELKTKIEEAKALAATITESETYKKTLEALKPAKKEEPKKEEAPVAEAAPEAVPVVEETPAVAATEAAAEAPKEEAKKDELTVEEPAKGRRSASRKRASIFGSVFGKKEEKKTDAAESEAAVAEAPAATTEAAAAEVVADPVEAAAPVAETEAKPEEKKEEAEAAKPTLAKRASLFSGLSFGKKKVASPEPTPAAEEAPATEAVAENAPVIPAVETTEPLTTETPAAATEAAPAEVTEAAETKVEEKKELKSEKRKSSLPFIGAFLNKEKATSDEETEKPKSPSPFSKLRATIKGKKEAKAEKSEEKTEEAPATVAEATTAEESAKPAEEAVKPAEVAAEASKEEEAPKTTPAPPVVSAAA